MTGFFFQQTLGSHWESNVGSLACTGSVYKALFFPTPYKPGYEAILLECNIALLVSFSGEFYRWLLVMRFFINIQSFQVSHSRRAWDRIKIVKVCSP